MVPSLLKSRRTLLLAVIVLIVAGVAWWAWPELGGYGTFHPDGGPDELLGDGVLATTDSDPDSHSGTRERETSEPTQIDGMAGKISRGWYVNGRQEYEETWVDGKQHGREAWWNDRGQMLTETHWRRGYWHGVRSWWYGNGNKGQEANYDHSRLHGTYRTWYRNGRESVRAEYRHGLREGSFEAWYANGNRQCQASLTEDRLHGTWKKWDEEGKLLREVVFRRGEVVTEWPEPAREAYTFPGELGSPDFALYVSQGSGWHGYSTLRISAAGRCEFDYFLWTRQVGSWGLGVLSGSGEDICMTQIWRRARFTLTDRMQLQLREALAEANLFGLKDQYIDENIADGAQWEVGLRAGGREKQIYCSNQFPERLKVLSRAIRERVVSPNRMEILTATRLESGEGQMHPAKWLEDVPR